MNDHNGSGHDGGAHRVPARDVRPRSSRTTTPSESPDTGMRVLSYIIAGIVLYGGLGWLLDHFLHQAWGLPVGLVVGMGLSIFMIIRRFGGPQ